MITRELEALMDSGGSGKSSAGVREIRDAVLIFNPRAGRARPGVLEQVRRIFHRQGIHSHLAPTDGPGAATELARQAVRENRQMVIVCGGDGTLNEAVNGLAGSHVPLALLPAGTANVLAKELGVPWNVERAAALVGHSTLRRIALGMVTTDDPADRNAGRYFLSVAGAGPDGALVQGVNNALKQRTGTLAYWVEGIRQLGLYTFPRFRVTADGKHHEATMVVLGRTKHYGGPFRITTEADLYGDDFEVMLCTTRSPWKYASYLGLLLAGQLRRGRDTRFFRATTVRCEPLDPSAPAWMQVDGELAGRLPAEFRIVPDALTLAVPQTGARRRTAPAS